jgi:PKD domain
VPRLKGCVGALITVGALAAAPAALAAPGWTPASAIPIPTISPVVQTQLGYQTGGAATLAFIEDDGPGDNTLYAGTTVPGEAFQLQLAEGATGGLSPSEVSLAVAPGGAAVLAWADAGSSTVDYYASFRPTGLTNWTTPQLIGTSSGSAAPLSTAIAPDGSTGAAALDAGQVQVATGGPGGFSVTLQAAGSAPALAYDSADQLTAAYEDSSDDIDAATLAAGASTWSAAATVATGAGGGPTLAVSADGSAALAFNAGGVLDAATRASDSAAWSQPTQLAANGTPLAAAVSSANRVYVLISNGDGCSIAASAFAVVGGLGAAGDTPQCLVTGPAASAGAVTLLGNDAYFAWSGSGTVAADSWGASAAAPGPPTTLTSGGSAVLGQLLGDGLGDIAALWSGGTDPLAGAAYEAAGPALVGYDVPSTGNADVTIAMNATFADPWSSIPALPTWSFGDGTAAETGAQVSHTYAAAGDYEVTVTVANTLGNTTTETFPVTVGGPPPSLTKVGQSVSKWTVTHGTTLRYTLNEAAQVTLVFVRTATSVIDGSLTVSGVAGANTLAFHGIITSPYGVLAPGGYTLSLIATEGGLVSGTQTRSFTIKSPPKPKPKPKAKAKKKKTKTKTKKASRKVKSKRQPRRIARLRVSVIR